MATLNSHNIEGATVLRSWIPREDAGENPLITEVFHATCATPGILPSIIVRGTASREFGQRLMAGTLHLHNPVKLARPELDKAFRMSRSDPPPQPNVIVSIGTQPHRWDLNENRHSTGAKLISAWNLLLGRALPTVPLMGGLNRVSNDSEAAHNHMVKDFPREMGIYHRFQSPRYEPTFKSRREEWITTGSRAFRAGLVFGLLPLSYYLCSNRCSNIARTVLPTYIVDAASCVYGWWGFKAVFSIVIGLVLLRHSAYLYDQVNELDLARQNTVKDEIER